MMPTRSPAPIPRAARKWANRDDAAARAPKVSVSSCPPRSGACTMRTAARAAGWRSMHSRAMLSRSRSPSKSSQRRAGEQRRWASAYETCSVSAAISFILHFLTREHGLLFGPGRPIMTGTQKVAVVTGASSGIGKASALALMKQGYAVVFSGRRKELLEAAAAEGKGTPGKSLVVQTDVTSHESIKALFAKTKETFGRLDVLFNNAGGGAPPVLFEDLTYDQWQNVVNANLTGVFLCSQEAFKIMKAQTPMGGRIINNGSISARAPRPNSAPYTATKHGVTGLTKVTSLDGRKYDIAVGQIDIGNAATDMTARMAKGVPQANGTTAVEPTMNVKAVADAVVYMSSLPLDANVLFLTVMATKMPFVGRG